MLSKASVLSALAAFVSVANAATTLTMNVQPTNLGEYASFDIVASTTTNIARNAKFELSVDQDAFTKDIKCGTVTTTTDGLTYTAATTKIEHKAEDGVRQFTGNFDLDAAQNEQSKPMRIVCAIRTNEKGDVNSVTDVFFKLESAEASAKSTASIIDAPCAKKVEMKIPIDLENMEIVISLKKTSHALNNLLVTVDKDVVEIPTPLAETVLPCVGKADGKDLGDITYSLVQATNSVKFVLPSTVASESDIKIVCEKTGLEFKKKFGVPVVANFQCVDAATPETTLRTSHYLLNSASMTSVVSIAIVSIVASLAIFV